MSPDERQDELIADLRACGGPSEVLQAVVEWVTGIAEVPTAERSDDLLVSGCMSRVWLSGGMSGGRLELRASSDSPLVGGLVRLECEIYAGATLQQVRETEPRLVEALGLERTLAPTRIRGLEAVRRRILELAEGL